MVHPIINHPQLGIGCTSGVAQYKEHQKICWSNPAVNSWQPIYRPFWTYLEPPRILSFFLIFQNGYGSIPINTIFSGMNIHKSQLFWCELQGYKVLTHCQMFLRFETSQMPIRKILSTHGRTHSHQVPHRLPRGDSQWLSFREEAQSKEAPDWVGGCGRTLMIWVQSLYDLSKLYWKFPKIGGVPLFFNYFNRIFHEKSSSYWGTPILGTTGFM